MLKLKCDVLLSTSAFKFNLRRYMVELAVLLDDVMYEMAYHAR